MTKKTQTWAVPVIAVLLGLLAGAILMLIFGYNPIFAYNDLLYKAFGSVKGIGEILATMAPLILVGLGFAVSSKAGFFNVGLPGQALAGWVLAAWFALTYGDHVSDAILPVSLLVACILYPIVVYLLFRKLKLSLSKRVLSKNLLYFLSIISSLIGAGILSWIILKVLPLILSLIPSRLFMIICTVIIGLVAGAVVGAIPGILRAYLGTSEVIVTIMMNYIVLYISQHLIGNVFSDDIMRNSTQTVKFAETATYRTEFFRNLTNNSHLGIGFIFALVAVAVIWFLLKKTRKGFEINAVGLNPHAAEYAGMSSKQIIILSMIISGALAGLGGTVYGFSVAENFNNQTSSLQIGWDGMAVALLAANNPIGVPFAAFLFSVLSVGKTGMTSVAPSEIIDVVSALIIFFVGSDYIIRRYLKPRKQMAKKGGK